MGSLFWLPLRLVWELVKAVAVPAGVVAVSWWLLPERAAQIATGIALLYLLGLGAYTVTALRGRMRSMTRGTFTIRDETGGEWDR
jgi:hypothetical protein